MLYPSLADLPSPSGRVGWPWTKVATPVPATRPDGSAWPRITIVTPSYNQGQYIEETIRSIILQGYPNLEFFVIDAGSNDTTVSVLEKYSTWIDYWHSRKDGGQPDAINMALRRATGVWFHNVNSDDVLLEGALVAIGCSPPEADLAVGDVIEFTDRNTYLVKNIGLSTRALIKNHFRTDSQSWHQPGVIFKTNLLRGIGGYPLELQYLFDHYVTCRYIETYNKVHWLHRPIMNFRIHANQKSTAWSEVYRSESIASRRMLANVLKSRKLRSISQREALRLEFWHHLSHFISSGGKKSALFTLLAALRADPGLIFDNMFLGSLRRHAGLYWRSLFRLRGH